MTQHSAQLNTFHAGMPEKLVVMTECCSCETQRGEDKDLPLTTGIDTNSSASWVPGTSTVFAASDNAACLKAQVRARDAGARGGGEGGARGGGSDEVDGRTDNWTCGGYADSHALGLLSPGDSF